MKWLISLAFFMTHLSYGKVFFQASMNHQATHELVWNFSEPRQDWGKGDKSQVTVSCSNASVPDYQVYWSNAKTLKAVFKKNLNPGADCEAFIFNEKERFRLKSPLIKVDQIYPWNFEALDEDSAFILKLEGVVDPDTLVKDIFVEVEDLKEKIEFDVVRGETRQEILKSAYLEDRPEHIVLWPRRNFPLNKKIAFVIQENSVFAFKKEGKIRAPFEIKMSCERTNATSPCSPLGKITLEFNSEVFGKYLRDVRLVHKQHVIKPEIISDDSTYTYLTFPGQLEPEAIYTVEVPESLEDTAGRRLSNAKKFPMKVSTSPFPPLAKFPGSFGILEAQTETILPVTVRNIEKKISLKKTSAIINIKDPLQLMRWRSAVDLRQDYYYKDLRDKSIFDEKTTTSNDSLEYKLEKNQSEVLGLPLKGKGLHIVELSSPKVAESILQNKKNFFISTSVLITNLATHLKVGQTNSLAWVTTLDKGEVVSGAEVKVYDCHGKMLQQGKTNNTGLVLFSKVTQKNTNCQSKYEGFSNKILAIASKDDDATYTLSDWNRGIETWRFALPWRDSSTSERVHTAFDRPVYKSGETVHMLHILRAQSDKGLVYSKNKYPKLIIRHPETNKEWTLSLKWQDAGNTFSEFVIPQEAPQGRYEVSLSQNKNDQTLYAGDFNVKNFRIPLIRADLFFQDHKSDFIQNETLKILGHLEYMAGGNNSDAQVTLRTEINPFFGGMAFKEYENYLFHFGDEEENPQRTGRILEKQIAETDDKGDVNFQIKNLPKSAMAQKLHAEIEYTDPNGAYQTKTISAVIYPYETLVGFKVDDKIYDLRIKKKNVFHFVLIDKNKKPLQNESYSVRLFKNITTSNRKKILGGFYSYSSTSRLEDQGEVCQGESDKQGKATCTLAIPTSGSYRLIAKSSDGQGLLDFYIYGDNSSWDEQNYNDRMDMIPDKKVYRIGDKAKLKLTLPFEKGTMLITKERAGIIKAYLAPFSKKSPFVIIPVEKEDYPNVFVSAFVVRGRLAQGQSTGLVDLAKPAYRMGLQEIQVESKAQVMGLDIIPNKKTFKIRERVKLKILAKNPDGSPAKNKKVAITVFDEGLNLIDQTNSFDALSTLIQNFPHQVDTATPQTHIIGKRHFGLKARPQGGSGGTDQKLRQIFETLVYWKADIQLNDKGEANVEFPLNDSLTSFIIRGLVYSQDSFGKSETKINTTQDILSFAGTSPTIRTGDDFFAHYTIKNLTSVNKTIRAELTLNGQKLANDNLKISGGQSVIFKKEVPSFKEAGEANYSLKLWDGKELIDELKTKQKILSLYTPRVQFTDLQEIKGQVLIPGHKTSPLYAGTQVSLSSTLLSGPETFKNYMRDYPYQCLEQQLARAIILEDKQLIQKIDNNLSSFIDTRGLLKFYPHPEGKGDLTVTSHFLEMSFWSGIKFKKNDQLEVALLNFITGQTKDLTVWEKQNFETLKLRAMVTLKLINSVHFSTSWTSEIPLASDKDSIWLLMDKWVLFYPQETASLAHDIIRNKLKIDGSTIALNSVDNESLLFNSPSTIYARFLLLQKKIPVDSGFKKFYENNEGKFILGYLGLKKAGHYGDTISNTYAFILQKLWTRPTVTGVTELNQQKANWKNNEAPLLTLNAEEGKNDQWLKHSGEGKPWADIQYSIFPDPNAKTVQGIDLSQTLSDPETGENYKVQERVELKITIETKSEVSMLGLRLPLPAGVTILSARSKDLYFDFEEKTESEWRGYVGHLNKGSYEIKILFRLNQSGDFEIPGMRAEALYSRDIFGELPYWSMKIK